MADSGREGQAGGTAPVLRSGAAGAPTDGSPSEPAAGPITVAEPEPSDVSASLTQLHETVKWMIGACAAVAAIIAGVVQVKGLGDLDPWQLVGAGIFAVCGLSVVLLTIKRAGSVLTTPRMSISELTDLEVRNLGISASPHIGKIDSILLRQVREQRSYLLDGFESIDEYYDRYLRLRRELHVLEDQLLNQPVSTAELVDRFNRVSFRTGNASRGIRRLEDTAQLLTAQDRFNRLTSWLLPGGLVFIVAAIGFGLVTADYGKSPQVTSSVRANIYVLDRNGMGLPPTCQAATLTGAIVGGSLAAPNIVTDAIPGCPGASFSSSEAFVAVPVAKP